MVDQRICNETRNISASGQKGVNRDLKRRSECVAESTKQKEFQEGRTAHEQTHQNKPSKIMTERGCGQWYFTRFLILVKAEKDQWVME